MTLKTRLGATLTALVLGFGGAIVASTPAQAVSSDCFSGKFCMWDDSSFNGALYMYNASTSCTNVVSQNNRASSLYNRTSRTVRYYDAANCSGTSYSIGSFTNDGTLTCQALCANWNDRISSFKQD